MTIRITEGNLSFVFTPNVSVQKYDDWSHYRNQFQNSCYKNNKAVDLIVLDNKEKRVWLIEIKDFRQHKRTKEIPLEDEIAIKIRDTLAGLVSAKFLANDANECNFAKKCLNAKEIRVVLHLEQKEKSVNSPYDPADLTQRLRKLLKAIDAHPLILDSDICNSIKIYPWHVEQIH